MAPKSFWILAFWFFPGHSTFVFCHSQQVSQLRLFGLEIFRVVRIGFATDWHLLHHLQAVAFQPDDLLRVVSQKTEPTHSEIEKDLRAEAVVSQIAGIPEPRVCLDRVESFLLQFVSVNFCREPYAASLLAHINQDTAAFLLNLPKRGVQLISAIA